MPGQTASVAQLPADDRLSLAGNLDSGFQGFSGDEPKRMHFLDGICLWWILDRQAERAALCYRLPIRLSHRLEQSLT